MMLLHCTASSSTFTAHPHHPERLPNLNLMVRAHLRNLMNRMLPWMVRTSPPLDIYMLYINHFAVYNPPQRLGTGSQTAAFPGIFQPSENHSQCTSVLGHVSHISARQ